MKSKTLLALAVILLANLVAQSAGLSCYTCAHFETGRIVGFNVSDSCKWGVKPEDRFLENCLGKDESNDVGNKFDFICTEMRVDGYYNNDNSRFVGTLRGCAARIIGTSKQPQNSTAPLAKRKECVQEKLRTVRNNFKDLTGKEYLVGMSSTFHENQTSVKFCACDDDGCWENREELPGMGGTRSNGRVTQPTFTLLCIISSLLVVLYLNAE